MKTGRFDPLLDPDVPIRSNRDQTGGGKSFASETRAANSGSVGGDLALALPERSEVDLSEDWWPPESSSTPDVAFATWGPPPPARESLIGRDERVRIDATGDFPWRGNASLQILAPDNSMYVGTGWFVGPRTLMTAGHCVYIHDHAGRFEDWARAIRVIPGRNGPATPFGFVTSTEFRTVIGWARDQDEQYDYAAIILPQPLGDTTGWYGSAVRPDAALAGEEAHIAGYPGDKVGELDGTMWYDSKPIVHVNERKIYYEVDTVGGQSGSAVFLIEDGQPLAVGIHAYGRNSFGNSATRINPNVFANITAWIDEKD